MSEIEAPGEPGASAPGAANPSAATGVEGEGGVAPAAVSPPAANAPVPRRRLLLALVPGVALVALVAWFVFFRGPADDLARMQGEWAIRGADGRDRGAVHIDGDRWTYVVAGREGSTHRISLNPAAREIDLTALESDGRPKTFTRGAAGVEMKELGVYAFAADALRIAKAPAWHGGARPKSLDDPDAPPALTLVRPGK